MKLKRLILLLTVPLFVACGNDSREETMGLPVAEEVKDSIPTLKGEFIFLDNAAVLKGEDFIYGVNIDSLALKLAEQLEPLKEDNFDMVPVVVKAKIIPNPRRDGWNELIEIREIVKIPFVKDTVEKSSEEE